MSSSASRRCSERSGREKSERATSPTTCPNGGVKVERLHRGLQEEPSAEEGEAAEAKAEDMQEDGDIEVGEEQAEQQQEEEEEEEEEPRRRSSRRSTRSRRSAQ